MTKRSVNNILLVALLVLWGCQLDRDGRYVPFAPPYIELENQYIDSLLEIMSVEEKIGQLLILKTDLGKEDLKTLVYPWIDAHQLGGIILNQLPIIDFLDVVEEVKEKGGLPLFVGSEAKFLMNNQFSDLNYLLPDANTLYALPNDTLKQNLLNLFVKQMMVLGINFNIGPVVDEFLPKGGITPLEYFKVKQSASPMEDLIVPLREQGILSIGDQFSAQRLFYNDSLLAIPELLYPYQELKRLGISGFKVAPELFADERTRTGYVRSFFQEKLDFEGLVVTEYSNNQPLDEVIYSGADLVIVNGDPGPLFDLFKSYIQQQMITLETLDNKVRRILLAKSWMRNGIEAEEVWLKRKLDQPSKQQASRKPTIKPFTKYSIHQHFTNENWNLLDRQLYENSIVLANNNESLLPFNDIYNRKFKVIEYAPDRLLAFEQYFNNYAANVEVIFHQIAYQEALPLPDLKEEATYIIVLDRVNLNAATDPNFFDYLIAQADRREIVLVNFGEQPSLSRLNRDLSVVQVFERNEITESVTGQMLFGALSAKGILPFDQNVYYRAEQGTNISSFRLKFAKAEEVGISSVQMAGIDAIANSAIEAGAAPGCQVAVAKEGKIIYSKSFGYHTYKENRRVRNNDLYDIASITKAAATTIAIMKLYEDGKIKVTDKLKDHLLLEDQSTIKNIRIRDLLTHGSGLQPNMPIGPYILVPDSSYTRRKYFSPVLNDDYNVQVADSFYFRGTYLDSIWFKTQDLPKKGNRRYRYSDVNFVILQRLVEAIAEVPFEVYLEETFYGPMGLKRTLFNPLSQYDTANIVPTQYDDKWRKQLIHGYVHDETAALMGGVSGNAGLFTNAEELAVIFQMLLNGGTYGGREYLSPKTINYFTSNRHGNHRGLGFDKPYPERRSALARSASSRSYGHTGFTGTCAWVDPEHDLVFVFLSNRVHPDRGNWELISLRVRERIHQVLYDGLGSYQPNLPDLDLDLDMPDI